MRGKIDIPPTIEGFMDLFMKDYYLALKENIFSGAPMFSTESEMYGGVVGRGTRGHVAVEVDATGKLFGPFVYLKDAWRVDHPGIEREGCVLETLNQHEVPFVPTLVCHGDLEGQATRSQDAWAQRKADNPRIKRSFKKHQHYRLVVAEVGKPLEEFGSGFKLVSAIFCCLLAHQAAYEKAGIVHRDISSGNIVLYKKRNGVWIGLLNDWELSKQVNAPAARQPDRTQFVSARALNNPDKEIVVEDELGAFFHMLLYHAVRFLPHNIDPDSVPKFLEDYFDGCSTKNGEYRCGMAKLMAMETGTIKLSTYNTMPASLKFLHPEDPNRSHVLDSFISQLLLSFKEAYASDPAAMPGPGQEPSQVQTGEDIDASRATLQAMPNVNDKGPVTLQKPKKSRAGKPKAPKPSRRSKRKAATAASDGPKPLSLEEHRPVIELFREFLSLKDWPPNDKGVDLRVKGVKVEEAPVSEGEGGSRSTKHQLDDPQPGPSTSKRSRI